MASSDDTASGTVEGSEKATETLSQFVARVLNQLPLSAWLPAAALVLLLALVTQLGAVLDRKPPPAGPLDALGRAFAAISRTSIGGALLLIAAVVVLTMVTQAFAFEAIRVLEGYWGTNRQAEWYANLRAEHFRKSRARLDRRLGQLTEDAWAHAARAIEDAARRAPPGAPAWTPDMISVLGSQLLGTVPLVTLTEEEMRRVQRLDWKRLAPPELVRRRLNVQKRLRDYPAGNRALPTRLGNILRRHEDLTRQESVETFIQRVFDDLPLSLRIEHDEQRTRLDLYCSMVFVLAVVTTVAAARFAARHWAYSAGAAGVGLAAAWMMYRAALASARAYGGLLVVISNRVRRDQARAATSAASAAAVAAQAAVGQAQAAAGQMAPPGGAPGASPPAPKPPRPRPPPPV